MGFSSQRELLLCEKRLLKRQTKIVQFETENVPKFSPRNSVPLKTRNQERSRVASELVSTAKIIAFAEQITINKPKKYKWELTTGWNCHPVILINR